MQFLHCSRWLVTASAMLSLVLLNTGCKQQNDYVANYAYDGFVSPDSSNTWVDHGRDPNLHSRIGLEDLDPFPLAAYDPPGEDARPWQYYEFPRTVCMNNTKAGLAVNERVDAKQAKDLLIYFQGGNACFNGMSCDSAHWKNGYSEREFISHSLEKQVFPTDFSGRYTYEGQGAYDRGIFNQRDHSENPFKDYNYVSIPYCTGDGYLGSAGTGFTNDAPGDYEETDKTSLKDGDFIFRGYHNAQEFIKWIVDRYENVENVVVVGQSAGAIGALYHFKSIHDQFNDRLSNKPQFSLIDDSGFTLLDRHVKDCAQATIRQRWKMDTGLQAVLGTTNLPNEFMDRVKEQVYALSDVKVSHIRSLEDPTLSLFYGLAVDVASNDSEITCRNNTNIFTQRNAFPFFLSDPAGTRRVTKALHDNVVAREGETAATVRSWLVPATRHQWLLGSDSMYPAVEPWKVDMPGTDRWGLKPGQSGYDSKNTSNSTTLANWVQAMLENDTSEWSNYYVPKSYCADRNDERDPYYAMDEALNGAYPYDGIFQEMCPF